MHERYLMWGSAIGVMMVAISAGPALLQLIIMLLGTANILYHMLSLDPNYQPALTRAVAASIPGTAWMLMLCSLIVLYIALSPGRRKGFHG